MGGSRGLRERLGLKGLSWLTGLASGEGSSGRLFILIYHQVLPEPDPMRPWEICADQFRMQMQLLSDYFNVLSLADGIRRLYEGTLPRRAVAITFDDGYRNNHSCALPILREVGLPATFFVATGFLDGGRMWNDTVIEALRLTRAKRLEIEPAGLSLPIDGDLASRAGLAERVLKAIKHLDYAQRAAAVEEIALLADALPDDLMMTSAQVADLAHEGMEIGAHTVNHPILARLSEGQAFEEMAQSKSTLEALLAKPVRLFAYPNGRPGEDYLPRDARLASELGFDAAVSTEPGACQRTIDRYQLKRFTPWDRSDLRFMARMARYYRL